MKRPLFAFASLLISAALAMPAFAQNNSDDGWDRIVLEDKGGNVLTSTGGEYQTAQIGKQLVVGEHMMLSGTSTKAKVVYYDLNDEGKIIRKCVKDYTDPNTYIIDATCTGAVAWTHGARPVGAGAGIIVGAAVIGGVIIDKKGDNVPVGPLSTSVRHL